MLAQNFKTAEELDIPETEQRALIEVLGMLERGDLKFAAEGERGEYLFNMGTWGEGCGTPACIGGWVATFTGQDRDEYVNSYSNPDGLRDLFLNSGVICGNVTVGQAAIALRSYLTTGDARWDLALAD